MAVRHRPPARDTTPSLFPGWEPPTPRWKPRPGNFAQTSQGQLAALVRGELIERLDNLLMKAIPVWEMQYSMPRAQSISLIQAVQLALFPDEFCDDEQAAEDIHKLIEDRRALVPIDGPIERVGYEAQAAYADYLGIQYDIPDPEPSGPTTVIGGVSFPASEGDVLKSRGR